MAKYKAQHPHLSAYTTEIERWVKNIDREVLIQAKEKIPARSIYTPQSFETVKKIAIAARVLQVTAIAITAYDLTVATDKSFKAKSIVPISRELIKQAGGWGGAWARFKIGALAGGAIGIETGPGAVISGAVGGIVFGVAGYWGADWALGPYRTFTGGATGSWGYSGASGTW